MLPSGMLCSDHITDLAPLYALANGRPGPSSGCDAWPDVLRPVPPYCTCAATHQVIPVQVWGPSGAPAATGITAIVERLRQVIS